MLSLLASERAEALLLERIRQMEADGTLGCKDSLMFGCLVARASGGQETVSYAFSGAWNGKYIIPGFVPPCFSVSEFDRIVSQYDPMIHCYSDRIERGEKELGPVRSALSNECLNELRSLYVFHSPAGRVRLCDMDTGPLPTGTGDCAAAKLINWCFRKGWEPLSMCEIFYGRDCAAHRHLERCTPCDAKCAPIMKYLFNLNLIYSDDEIAVVDKEAGLLSVPGRGEDKQDCVSKRMRMIFPSAPENPSVHRLDMDTSGILVLAKTESAKRSLSMQFEHRNTEKTYIALLDGLVREDEGVIDLPMRLDVDNRPRQIIDHLQGKRAVTRFERIRVEIRDGRTVTRVRFRPLTGRTHQLRVHAASALFPIVGDRLYGSRKEGERLCLHAESLTFSHPASGERLTFTSPCPF